MPKLVHGVSYTLDSNIWDQLWQYMKQDLRYKKMLTRNEVSCTAWPPYNKPFLTYAMQESRDGDSTYQLKLGTDTVCLLGGNLVQRSYFPRYVNLHPLEKEIGKVSFSTASR